MKIFKIKLTPSTAEKQAEICFNKLKNGQVPCINNYEVLDHFLTLCEKNNINIMAYREDIKNNVEFSATDLRIAMAHNIDLLPKS